MIPSAHISTFKVQGFSSITSGAENAGDILPWSVSCVYIFLRSFEVPKSAILRNLGPSWY